MLAEFNFERPTSLNEALECMAGNTVTGAPNGEGSVAVLAGGSNLMLDLRAAKYYPETVLDLNNVDELRGIEVADGRVTVGARTTVSDILRYPEMERFAPSLVASGRVFAGQMVRNVATIAGNICCGSPASDTVTPLLSLDAEVELQSLKATRTVPLNEFFTGYKQDVRQATELVTNISWPIPAESVVNAFYKLGRRKGDAITVVGVATSIGIENGVCNLARIALGSVGASVFRATQAEEVLLGQDLTQTVIDQSAAMVKEECSPIDDVRASGEYRKNVVPNIVRRMLMQAAGLSE